MAQAQRRARLSDFGDDRFREGLRVLVDVFNDQNTAHAFGRIFFREYCTQLLVNRLRIQADLTRHPEILDVPIAKPLFITGPPRSGTTFLHRLMAQDPACRTMLYWETVQPSPSPQRETYRTDPRIALARKQVEFLNQLSPRLAVAHEFEAESAEEDNGLFAHAFAAGMLGFMFDVPDYVRWLDDQDLIGPYRYLKQQLQLLSWKYRGDYWLSKAPAHLFGLDALLTVFPDACVVVMHRDPHKVIPSVCSLAAALRSIQTDRLDLRRLGSEMVQGLSEGPKRARAARAQLDASHFFDVSYDQFVANPIGTVRSIHQHFGYDFSPEFESKARRWLAENPARKHGVHQYSLGDFGLDSATIEENFPDDLAWLRTHQAEVR